MFMDSDQRREAASFVSGLVLGAIIGAGVALLTAPQSGRRTRRRLRRSASDVRDSAGGRLDELAGEVRDKVDKALGGARKHLVR
jgi:gas vesicle protein